MLWIFVSISCILLRIAPVFWMTAVLSGQIRASVFVSEACTTLMWWVIFVWICRVQTRFISSCDCSRVFDRVYLRWNCVALALGYMCALLFIPSSCWLSHSTHFWPHSAQHEERYKASACLRGLRCTGTLVSVLHSSSSLLLHCCAHSLIFYVYFSRRVLPHCPSHAYCSAPVLIILICWWPFSK